MADGAPDACRQALADTLLAARNDAGHWRGRLASSALSTATAVTALTLSGAGDEGLTAAGLRWLAATQNADGGWGDTVESPTNISTTSLVWGTLVLTGAEPEARERAERWLTAAAGGVAPELLAPAIVRTYGKDRTFSVPILTMLALCGALGDGPAAWRRVPQLPFELAALPRSWFGALKLPVVSYAIPALIAIGRVRHHHRPTLNPLARLARGLTSSRTLRVLRDVQPTTGGFLEATPLTSFVVMSLAGCGLADDPVAREGLRFLRDQAREDGSWPIDTDLATWVTTLAVKALTAGGRPLDDAVAGPIRAWLLAQQYTAVHPYTLAPPGGWAWTELAGGVPDADDTAGALIALRALGPVDEAAREAAAAGVGWLLDLQNRDGGVPTFCRGWGTLPFDRSGPDLTAHALAAWAAWEDALPEDVGRRVGPARARALAYLARVQRPDGSWLPLWFGNQQTSDQENPVYGTSAVLLGLAGPDAAARVGPAVAWLTSAQREDGGWGGAADCPPSIEETGMATAALATHGATDAAARGAAWLAEHVDPDQPLPASPIGLYFARLWYDEALYPTLFALRGLNAAR